MGEWSVIVTLQNGPTKIRIYSKYLRANILELQYLFYVLNHRIPLARDNCDSYKKKRGVSGLTYLEA